MLLIESIYTKLLTHPPITASMLGISSAVVYRLINTHHLVAFKHDHGRDWYILGQDILDYIAEQKEVSKKSWKK
jgi:hypothetical protein